MQKFHHNGNIWYTKFESISWTAGKFTEILQHLFFSHICRQSPDIDENPEIVEIPDDDTQSVVGNDLPEVDVSRYTTKVSRGCDWILSLW